jgi:hypothetical protein
LPRLVDGLGASRRYWRAQDEHLDASEALVESGRVAIEEEPELDLAVVRIPGGYRPREARRYLRPENAPVHPFAIHNATRCTRLVRIQGRQIELQYRYESWLELQSRRPAPRVDLAPFGRWLNRRERNGRWHWDGTLEIAPRLYLGGGGDSSIEPAVFMRELRRCLRALPPAWDPHHWRAGGRA